MAEFYSLAELRARRARSQRQRVIRQLLAWNVLGLVVAFFFYPPLAGFETVTVSYLTWKLFNGKEQ